MKLEAYSEDNRGVLLDTLTIDENTLYQDFLNFVNGYKNVYFFYNNDEDVFLTPFIEENETVKDFLEYIFDLMKNNDENMLYYHVFTY